MVQGVALSETPAKTSNRVMRLNWMTFAATMSPSWAAPWGEGKLRVEIRRKGPRFVQKNRKANPP